MKIGIRTPSLSKSIKARTTGRVKRKIKSSINPFYGKKGVGLITNPKKAVYNKVYNKTTIGVSDIAKKSVATIKKEDLTNNTCAKSNVNYTILDKETVCINNVKYSRKNIGLFKNIFLLSSILLVILSLCILPIGIIFIIIAIILFLSYKQYKKIYDEMNNF